MSDAYWPWWAVITFFTSGAFSAWVVTIARRPSSGRCPNCGERVRVRILHGHWKECTS